MKRVIQMPFTGNPYLLTLWVRLYLERWRKEVDGVLVLINGDNMDSDVRCYCEYLLEAAGIQYIYSNTRLNHGTAIDVLLSVGVANGATHMGLVEEDGFIFKSGQVQYCWDILTSGQYDVVAGRRGSCSAWLIELGKQLWGTEDHGPNFWPNFFFSQTSLLLKTDRDFNAKTWQPKEVVFRHNLDLHNTKPKELAVPQGTDVETYIDYDGAGWLPDASPNYQTFAHNELTVGDTFVNTSLQIRYGVPSDRIFLLPQYHCVPADLEDYAKKDQVFDGRCPWIHVGSLSSWYSLLMSDSLPGDPGCDPAEWERRAAFFSLFQDCLSLNNTVIDELVGWHPDYISLDDFDERYTAGLERMVKGYNLNEENIERCIAIYSDLMQL